MLVLANIGLIVHQSNLTGWQVEVPEEIGASDSMLVGDCAVGKLSGGLRRQGVLWHPLVSLDYLEPRNAVVIGKLDPILCVSDPK